MTPLRASALPMVALLVACGGAQESMPSDYGYGDMFANDSRNTSYRGGGGGGGDMTEAEEEPMMELDSESSGSFGRSRSFRRSSRSAPPPPPAPSVMAQAAPTGGEAAATTPAPDLGPTPPQTTEPQAGQETAGEGHEDEPAQEGERRGPMLIYEAALRLATRQELSDQIDLVSAYAIGIGGFVVTQDNSSIVVRVPAPRFREALDHLESLGDVVGRRISAMDVSEQVRDLRVRLQNAINLRDRLLELLEQATTVAESLVINHELERLNEQIALMQGSLEGLEERISFSTITVNFQAVQDHQEVPNELFRLPFSWLDELGLQHLLRL